MLDAALSRMEKVSRKACFASLREMPLDDVAKAFERAVEFLEIEGFCQVDVRARFQCGLLHSVDVVSRDRHNWRVVTLRFALAEILDGFQTIQNGHVQVHYNQAWTIVLRDIKRLLPIRRL